MTFRVFPVPFGGILTSPTIDTGRVLPVPGSGLWGGATVPLSLSPNGIAPTGGVGPPTFVLAQFVSVDGIAPTGGVGAPTLKSLNLLFPDGVGPTSEVGEPTLTVTFTLLPDGIGPTSVVGEPTIVVESPPEDLTLIVEIEGEDGSLSALGVVTSPLQRLRHPDSRRIGHVPPRDTMVSVPVARRESRFIKVKPHSPPRITRI